MPGARKVPGMEQCCNWVQSAYAAHRRPSYCLSPRSICVEPVPEECAGCRARSIRNRLMVFLGDRFRIVFCVKQSLCLSGVRRVCCFARLRVSQSICSAEWSVIFIIIIVVIWFSYPPAHPGARPSCPLPKLSLPIKLPALDLGVHQIALHFASPANSGLPLGLSPFILFSLNHSGASIFILVFEVSRLVKRRPWLW